MFSSFLTPRARAAGTLAGLACLLLTGTVSKANGSDESLVCGLCYAVDEDNQAFAIPLETTEVVLNVKPGLLEAEVIQTFSNRTSTALEATYLYPLPDGATLTHFELRYENRVIQSVVREKQQAQAVYDTAKAEGRKTALLHQQDPSLFSTAVANFMPGETVQTVIRFIQPLTFSGGVVEVRFPMVAGDKYFLPKVPSESVSTLELNPLRRFGNAVASQHSYAFDIEVAGFPASTILCPSHRVDIEDGGDDGRIRIALTDAITVPDRDFLLRIEPKLIGMVQPVLATQRTEVGDYGLLTIFPPFARQISERPARPRDILFLLDRSGSMKGQRFTSAKLGLETCLRTLLPDDRFQIVVFDSDWAFYRPDWQLATERAVDAGCRYVRGLETDGDTNMQPALAASLDRFVPDDREQLLIFLTDGDVGDEDRLLDLIETKIGRVRLFTFGIGSAPNAYLINRMAELGRGQARFIADDQDIARELTDLFTTLDAPVLTDLEVTLLDAAGAPLGYQAFPEKWADVFVGRPLQMVYHATQGTPVSVVIAGREDTRTVHHVLNLRPEPLRGDGIEKQFGRQAYDALAVMMRRAKTEEERSLIRQELLATALQYQLVTDLTSRVAVEERIARAEEAALVSKSVGQFSPADQVGGSSGTADSPLMMEVYTVNASGDVGYLSQGSFLGSRMSTNLRDLATPSTVFTVEFLRDVAVNDTDALATYMVSTQYAHNTESPGENGVNADARQLKVRGLPGGTRSVNFFATELRFDNFSADRIEQSRGPNAVLFGIGSPGGIINVTTKRAYLNRQSTEVSLAASSHHGLREEIDFNQPLIKDRLALRIAAVADDVDSWRNYEYDNQDRIFGTLKLEVARHTELNVEGESGHVEMTRKRTYLAHDGFSPWLAANKTLGLTGNARFYDRQTTFGADGYTLVTGAPNKEYFMDHGIRFQSQAGGTGAGNAAMPYVVYDTENDTLYNLANQLASARGMSAENLALSVPPGSLQPYGATADDPSLGHLSKETILYGPGYFQTTDYDRLSAFLSHRFNEHFSAELAAFRLTTHREVYDPSQSLQLNVDIDASIPDADGAMDADGSAAVDANPNVGRPYLEAYPEIDTQNQDDRSLRLSLASDYDFGFFGHHRLAGVYQYYTRDRDRQVLREQIVNDPYNSGSLSHAQNRIWRRTYLGAPVGDAEEHNWTLEGVASGNIVMADWRLADFQNQPIRANTTGAAKGGIVTDWLPFDNDNTATTASGPDKLVGDSTIFALQSDFWQRRLFTLLGYSLDHQTHQEGRYFYGEATAPFTEGPIVTFLDPVGKETEADNKSIGAVFHATPWLSFTFNHGSSLTIPEATGRMPDIEGNATRAPIATGETRDVGFKLDLFDHRIFFTALYFDTTVKDDFETFGISQTAYQPIWSALTTYNNQHPLDPYLIRMRNSDGKILTPDNVEYSDSNLSSVYAGETSVQSNGTAFDAEATGIELELTANFTEHWRMMANYNHSSLRRSSIGTEMMAYLDKWRSTWQYHEGLPLGANAVNDFVGDQLETIDNLVTTTFLAPDGELPVGYSPSKANLRMAYDFSRGWLKGVSINGGVRYQGPSVLAYSVDAALDPDTGFYFPIDADGRRISYEPGSGYANLSRKITGKRAIMGEAQYFFDASVGYKRKVKIMGNRKAVWSVQLNVNNVLNNDDLVTTRVSAYGDHRPIGYRFNPPREWIVTTRLRF